MSLESLLLQTANKSNMHTEYACAIIYKNKIIATGTNFYITNRCNLEKSCLL